MPVLYAQSLGTFREDMRHSHRIPMMLASIFHPGERLSPEEAHKTDSSEFRSWDASLGFMRNAIDLGGLPDDCGVMLEYQLPTSSRRVDMIVTGEGEDEKKNAVIVELKQWSHAKPIPDQPGVVEVENVRGENRKAHPSYQAWSYQRLLETMKVPVYEDLIHPYACAYMHNAFSGVEALRASPNDVFAERAPLFGALDQAKLGEYLSKHVGRGKGIGILWELRDGKLTPAPRLIDEVGKLFAERKKEEDGFALIDEQKVVFERLKSEVRRTVDANIAARNSASPRYNRLALIVEGGPGTGKSVVALTAFSDLLRLWRRDPDGRNIRFISPTASYRAGIEEMLTGSRKKDRMQELGTNAAIKGLFTPALTLYDEESERDGAPGFDPALIEPKYSALIVDEAHRLNVRQNMYRGKSMVQDVIRAAGASVFFLDEDQCIRPVDEGTVARIREVAKEYGAEVVGPLKLTAQFRCQGAEGFLNWLADMLQMGSSRTANEEGWDRSAFDFGICDDPRDVKAWVDAINARPRAGEREKAGIIRGARMLAGYAWDWSKGLAPDGTLPLDVKILGPDGRIALELPWNSRKAGPDWCLDDSTRGEVGCVHTTQGLEVEYVGVFIGPDLRYDPEKKKLFADYDSYRDIAGKTGLKANGLKLKGAALKAARDREILTYVRRCYRVLLSRGIKGARVYCCDPELGKYLKARLAAAKDIRDFR